jgi:hypothetical protein
MIYSDADFIQNLILLFLMTDFSYRLYKRNLTNWKLLWYKYTSPPIEIRNNDKLDENLKNKFDDL